MAGNEEYVSEARKCLAGSPQAVAVPSRPTVDP